MFFWNSCFFHDPADVGNLISGSSAFPKTSLNIREFMVHLLLKPGLENFEHYFTSMWDECNCAVVWAFFGIAFLSDWNENWPFPVLRPLLSFPNLYMCIKHIKKGPNYFSKVCHFPFLLAVNESFSCSPSLTILGMVSLYHFSHSDKWEVLPYCSFDWHFLND